MVFDFSNAENRTQSETVELVLGELKGMDEVQVHLQWDETQIVRYPDSAAGSLGCSIEISINGDEWHRNHITDGTLRGDPAHWSGSLDEVKHHHPLTLAFPQRPRDVATEHFTPSGENRIEAWVTCSNTVESTGPALVVVDFVLHAVVAMEGPGETYRPNPDPQPLPTLQERRPSSTPEASTRTPPSP